MKQNSIDWLFEQVWINPVSKLPEILEQAKAMHREEIVKAYNRDVINKKQNWAIENGERYYNLHYKGEDNKGKYNSDKPNQDYKFEDGI